MDSSGEETKITLKKMGRVVERSPNDHYPFLIVRDSVKDQIFYLTPSQSVTIGRATSADIYINDEQASRQHAFLVWEESRVKLRDNASTNGTTVNGKPIDEKFLDDGDEVIIGSTIINFFVPMSIGDQALGPTVKTHNYFEMRLAEELDQASRYRRSLSLAMIGVELPKDGKPDDLLEILVRVINQLIRGKDLLALYSPGEFELMLPETTKPEAYQVAKKISADARKSGVKLSIGIASYPEDASSRELLIEQSRKALRLSRQKKSDKISATRDNVKRIEFHERNVIIQSEKTIQVFDLVSRIASSNISVLILGETGVGKEVVAETIHYQSPRRDKPLISLNCAALTETLLESEMFGHEKGSFTGADRQKIGLFESANGGTIFLDEISEMPLKIQAKLLRVLQSRRFMRVGSSQEISVDVRIIAASNRNLEKEIQQNRFREDLYYRLNAITITLPPLRERKEEIVPLVESFITTFNQENNRDIQSISSDAIELLLRYPWPGNVRELQNCIERAVVIAEGPIIQKEHLGAKFFQAGATSDTNSDDHHPTLAGEADDGGTKETFVGDMKEIVQNYERRVIISALKKAAWNQTKAANALNIPRRTLVSKIKKYGIKRGSG